MNSEKSLVEPANPSTSKSNPLNYFEGREVEFFKVLDSSLDMGVSILDENMIYQYISQSVYRELGFSPKELGPGDSLSRCHELMIENGLLNSEILSRNMLGATEQKQRSNLIAKSKFDTVELANGTVQRFLRKKLPNGHIISMATDITDIVEQERILESSLFLGKSGYWIYDFKSKTHKISESIEKFAPKNITKLIRKQGIVAFIHPEDRYLFKTAIQSLTKTNGAFEFTARVLGQDPNIEYACLFTGVAVKNKAGEWFKLRTFVKDVTRERQQSLELERAKDEALAASHAKSQFLANMSHEIRTPMNGVLGMAELLSGTDINARQREFLNIIVQSSSALLTIINDILDFSKIEAGALTLDPMPLNLREIVNTVATLLNTNNKNDDVELVVNYPSGLPAGFIGDAGRLRQILTNLVGNALKFTKKGHVVIDVNIRLVSGSHAVVSIDVTDTGIGIEEDKIGDVFKKFTQADGSTTRLYGGTGLGLSISKHLVEMMNGRVGLKSKLGEGSVFGFKIPLELDKAVKLESFDTQKLCCRRVLIVDDIDVNRLILTERCKAWSMISDCAENGVEALEMLKVAEENNTPYDVILLDFLMPGMNGLEFAKLVKERFTTNPYSVIMLSSVDQASTTSELKEMGVHTYLTKPAPEKTLFKALNDTFLEKTAILGPKSPETTPPKSLLDDTSKMPALDVLTPALAPEPAETVDITKTINTEVIESKPIQSVEVNPQPVPVQKTPHPAQHTSKSPSAPKPDTNIAAAIDDREPAETKTLSTPSHDLEVAFNEFDDAELTSSDLDIIAAMDIERSKSKDPSIENMPVLETSELKDPAQKNEVADAVKRPEAPVETSAKIHTETKNADKDEKIQLLVAEDFELNQDVIRLMLSDTHFSPTFANNGKEAYEEYCANHEKYSVIIMDVSMPVMDGYESTKQIQLFEREHDLPLTPIIALTGHALSHDRQLCIDAGMDDYITKPVKKDTLMERLNHYSSSQQNARAPKAAFG